MRKDYEDMAFAADAIQRATTALAILWSGETVDERNARLGRTLEEATGNLARPILRLQLEEGAARIVELYSDLRGAWSRYANVEIPRAEREQQGYPDLIKTAEEIESYVAAILDKAKTDLDELGKPL